jgi:pectate lyase
MLSKRRTHLALAALFLLIVLPGILAQNSWADEDSKYLKAVREFADNVLKYGRDTYGPKHTPLFVDGLNIHTHEPVKWISSDGEKWILSNLASQQNLFRTLDGLSKITGDPKYRQAAAHAIEHALSNLRRPDGLLYWGATAAYDAQTDKCHEQSHCLKGVYPYYELMWDVNPDVTRRMIESFWASHIWDWSNLDMDRHGPFDRVWIPRGWDHEYKGGPVFFQSKVRWARSFSVTGSDLFYAAAILSSLSGDKRPLVWGKRLAHRYVETRHPKTGISDVIYNLSGWDEQKWHQFPEYSPRHSKDPRIAFFPHNPFPTDNRLWSGTPLIHPYIGQLLLGEILGTEGKEFKQWALEELTAWGKVAYRKKDNSFIPMLTDGTKLEGHVCRRDGWFGPRGIVVKACPVGPLFFWAYALAYRVTGDEFMRDMARNIALGNNLGDIALTGEQSPELQMWSDCSDPYALLGLLELYRKTQNQAFLDMAKKTGDTILSERFHNGLFVPSKKHIYARFDAVEALVLLHLETASRTKQPQIPQIWPSLAFFEQPYGGRASAADIYLIYTLTESDEPANSLQEVAVAGDIDEVKSLISKGCDIDSWEAGFEGPPLCGASIKGHKKVVGLLLSHGADINGGDMSASTALHHAVQHNHLEVARLLISKGANVNARNAFGDTPLHYTIRNNNRDIAELLIDSGAEVTMQVAAYVGDLEKVKRLAEQGVNVSTEDKSGLTPLYAAIVGNHKEVIEFLIACGADVNAGKWTPLHSAANEQRHDIVELLIKNGANVNAKDGMEQTPLCYAIWNEDVDVVKLFLANGARLHEKDIIGWTAFRYAASQGSRELVNLFVDEGADVSGLHMAACVGDLDRVKGFFEHESDVDVKDELNWTPLYWAVSIGQRDVVKFLIAKGARVNATTYDRRTPLHQAAQSGDKETVAILISNGADVNSEDKRGLTPLSIAKRNGHTPIVELLRKHGAKE